MKIGKTEIFIGIGGVLVGALAYKYLYSGKMVTSTTRSPAPDATDTTDGSEEAPADDESANFLGFGKRKARAMEAAQNAVEMAKSKGMGMDKVKKAYIESVKMGVSPAFATKEIAMKIKRSRNPKKDKMRALASLRDVSTIVNKRGVLDFNGAEGL